jgi:hypothetical protein
MAADVPMMKYLKRKKNLNFANCVWTWATNAPLRKAAKIWSTVEPIRKWSKIHERTI